MGGALWYIVLCAKEVQYTLIAVQYSYLQELTRVKKLVGSAQPVTFVLTHK